MRKISDTIERLAALKTLHKTGPANRRTSLDRLTLLQDFGSNPGALTARFYLPNDAPEDCPLVVVLHGCTQSALSYDHYSGWSQLADEAGFALLYPEQQRGNNPNLCFNWFLPGDTQRHAGEVLSIRQMIDAMVGTHRLDRDRIFITGLSAGGAMAAAMLATYPEVFAGGAIIAGLAHGTARTIPEAFDSMRGHGLPTGQALQQGLRDASDHRGPWPRISIWHGTADQTVAPANAEMIAAQWRSVHQLDKAPTYSRANGAHAKHVWCDAIGEAVMEINMIAGMAHGTPIASAPGPFMLDVGISSTREIAGFWGIASADADRTSMRTNSASPTPRSAGAPGRALEPERPTIALSKEPPVTNPSGIQKILDDAFRAAGLMR